MSSVEPIYLDIETIPTQDERIRASIVKSVQGRMETELADVKAPGNLKDPEKIAEAITKKRAEIQAAAQADLETEYRKTGLDGAFGQVAVCSIASGDGAPRAIYQEDWQSPGAERLVLEEINDTLADICGRFRGQMLIGHNVVKFDRKFLRQRGIVHGIKMHRLITQEVKPWDTGVIFDTMLVWSGDPRDMVSMDKLCRAFDIPSKGDIDGSKVWDYVQAGRIAEVADYCNGDVERTRAIYKRLMYLGLTQQAPQFDDIQA